MMPPCTDLTMTSSALLTSASLGSRSPWPLRQPTKTKSQSCPIWRDSSTRSAKVSSSVGFLSTYMIGVMTPPWPFAKRCFSSALASSGSSVRAKTNSICCGSGCMRAALSRLWNPVMIMVRGFRRLKGWALWHRWGGGSGPGAGAPDHPLGNEMARRREEVEGEQAEAASQFERADVVGKGADYMVAEEGAAPAVEAAVSGVVFENATVEGIFQQNLGKFPVIADAEVEALAGDRVQGLGRVADPDFAALGQRVAHPQGERKAAARAGFGEIQALAELLLQDSEESGVVQRHDGIGLGRRQREDDGKFVAERQQGERAVGREAFPGALAVAGRRGDFADHGVLVVVADAHRRIVAGRAFGMHQQAGADRLQLAGVAQRHGDAVVVRGDVEDFGLGQHGVGRQVGGQRAGQVAVADDVAERRQGVVGAVDQGAAEAVLLGNMDGFDRRCGTARPAVDLFEQLAGAMRQRQGARVALLGGEGAAVEQQRFLAAGGQGQM